MGISEIRKKYLDFFQRSPRDHKLIPASPLILKDDPSTLFTSAGMQPLVPYLKGEKHSLGSRLVNSQPCIRTQDIDEVSDNRHTTFFEMLGNWSLGDYFKKEQLTWFWEFLTKELMLPSEKLYVSVFKGDGDISRDEESYQIWRELGVAEDHIFEYGVDKNWWSIAGAPENMPEGEIGGPDSEVFFEFDSVTHDSKFGEKCHPNCDCGRFLEIGNSVFIEYIKKNGKLQELPQKNVDFGGGLERIAASVNNDPDIFKIDVFEGAIYLIEKFTGASYEPSMRIIVDHMRASAFLLNEGIVPSNKLHGYVLRRLIRRSAFKLQKLKGDSDISRFLADLVSYFLHSYKDMGYLDLSKEDSFRATVYAEVENFSKTLDKGLKRLQRLPKITGKIAFDLYQSFGFPLELTLEILREKGQEIDQQEFRNEFVKHQDISRSVGVFKGGLIDQSIETIRLHTATHLLHSALRKVLGDSVFQKGSNITPERLRFDFSYDKKLTDEQVSQVEVLVNEQIDKSLPVSFEEKTLEEAKLEGALANFGERYGERVFVYTIGDPRGEWFSKEVCGGPHVGSLSQMNGHVRIIKQESVSLGVRRIYAIIK